jgi:4-amino-4-deoxy-L-arabinose transferase-like glycosyltransferase
MRSTPNTLLLILLASFAIFLIFLPLDELWWDPAVYIGIGKYLWSGGESGFIEPSRPLMLPFLLGFFWKIGVNEAIAAQALALLFSLGTLILTYMLGKRLHGEYVGLLAAFFVAFTPTFLFFSSQALTEIPSTFFLLLGINLFFRQRHLEAGMWMGVAFATRYFQAFFIVIFFIALLLLRKKRKKTSLIPMLKGFLLVVIPLLLLFMAMYSNPLKPFTLQYELSTSTGVIYGQPFFFYFVSLLKENFFLLAMCALPFLKNREETKIIAIPALLTLLVYSIFPHKEIRILLVILPLLFIVASYTIVSLGHRWGNTFPQVPIVFALLVLVWLSISLTNFFPLHKPLVSLQENYFKNHMKIHEDKLYWISNPKYALYSDAKVAGLMYYPEIAGTPDTALISSCDFEGNTAEYYAKTMQHVAMVEQTMRNIYTSSENGCVYRMFEKITS